jgi:hypothetical protein
MSPSRKFSCKINFTRFVQFTKDEGREPVMELLLRIRSLNLKSSPIFLWSLPLNLLPYNSRLVSLARFTMSLLMGPERSLEGKEISSNPVALYISLGSRPKRELKPALKTLSFEHAPSPLRIWLL